MNKKILVLPLAALAAGITLTACSTSAPAPAVTHTATSAPASSTPAAVTSAPAATASPVGTWDVAYSSAPAQILGQYSITGDGGFYHMTTKTVLKVPDGNCSLHSGTEIGVFSEGNGPGTFAGTENLYESGTCAPNTSPATAALTVTISGNTMILLVPNQQAVTLTRAGSTSSSSPPATAAPVASAPAASPADCIVPDVIGAGLNGHIAASAAENKVASTCPPVGYHVVTVLTVSGPAGTPAGELWKESPPAGSSEAAGSTVTLYFQP